MASAKKKGVAYPIYASLLIIMGIMFLAHAGLVSYVLWSPNSIKKERISKISYGPVRISGSIVDESGKYGQVSISKIDITDGSKAVTVMFGLFSRIEDPVKKHNRDNLNVKRMSIEQAKRMLNAPIYYSKIEVIGIYYPVISSVYAYHIKGDTKGSKFKITGLEYVILITNILLSIICLFFGILSLMKNFR